jgi:hypothetical protein
MIGTMIKNGARWLPRYWEMIKKLTYPKEKLRIVFIYGESFDNTLDILKDMKREKLIEIDVYAEVRSNALRVGGDNMAAEVYNDFKLNMKDDEDYFMLLDCDVVECPNDLIEKLIEVNADIVAPYPWSEGHRHFYDNWIFRIDNKRFSPISPPGTKLKYPIYVDSVGTCFLVKREAWINAPIGNPYPNLVFCNAARNMGYNVVACPYLEIYHVDVEKLGLMHNPMPQEYGGYPSSPEFLNESFIVKRFENE